MTKVLIVFGGTTAERFVSVESARVILANVDRDAFDVQSAEILADGHWEFQGADEPLTIADALRAIARFDVVFPVLHGSMGEDGTIQAAGSSIPTNRNIRPLRPTLAIPAPTTTAKLVEVAA